MRDFVGVDSVGEVSGGGRRAEYVGVTVASPSSELVIAGIVKVGVKKSSAMEEVVDAVEPVHEKVSEKVELVVSSPFSGSGQPGPEQTQG